MKIVSVNPQSEEVLRLSSREPAPSMEIQELVRNIIDDVRKGGLAVAVQYAQKHDGLQGNDLRISAAEIAEAAEKTPPTLRKALDTAMHNIRHFHEHQKESSWEFTGPHGEVLGQKVRPMHRVGLYVPGGAGVYPSTLMMNAIPAQVAGVKDLVVVTPAPDGLQPAVAYVVQRLGIDEVYHIGGAQAVALLAYGATHIAPVDKIVGPGNVYAAVAKKEVFGTVDIDMIAGPSEILVMADSSANAEWGAADLLSQAEHGSGYEAAICITDDESWAQKLSAEVQKQVAASPKKSILEKSLAAYGRILLVEDWEIGVAIADAIAPEHLEIQSSNSEALAEQIQNAGAIFIGPWSSESVGDYFAGPNHVLPTNGTARFFSPLGVYDFVKRTSIIKYTKEAAQTHARAIGEIAAAEGFYHHGQAALKRL